MSRRDDVLRRLRNLDADQFDSVAHGNAAHARIATSEIARLEHELSLPELPSSVPALPHVVLSMTPDELRAEWRAQEDALIQADTDQLAIAEAVWPEGTSEMPHDVDEVTLDVIVSGIVSLHEFTDRLIAENGRLRAQLAALPPKLTALDLADIASELGAREQQLAELVLRSLSHRAPAAQEQLLGRMGRVRQLIVLLRGGQ